MIVRRSREVALVSRGRRVRREMSLLHSSLPSSFLMYHAGALVPTKLSVGAGANRARGSLMY